MKIFLTFILGFFTSMILTLSFVKSVVDFRDEMITDTYLSELMIKSTENISSGNYQYAEYIESEIEEIIKNKSIHEYQWSYWEPINAIFAIYLFSQPVDKNKWFFLNDAHLARVKMISEKQKK